MTIDVFTASERCFKQEELSRSQNGQGVSMRCSSRRDILLAHKKPPIDIFGQKIHSGHTRKISKMVKNTQNSERAFAKFIPSALQIVHHPVFFSARSLKVL